jgi:hypothetical protein
VTGPQIILGHEVAGFHNSSGDAADRLKKSRSYQDLSTVCVIPTRGLIQARVVETWMGLIPPMNQKFSRVMVKGMEVGDAYNAAVELILDHPVLSTWRYVLTLEEDNLPPPDGLLKLYESIGDYDVVGGLYWTKGEGGQPMIYGKPEGILNFIPQVPEAETVQECNGLGMGFNLFRLDLFRDEKLPRPWFKTVQDWDTTKGAELFTQDLWFYKNLKATGRRVACDTRVKVGHIDEEGFVW